MDQPLYEVRALGTLPASARWEFRRLAVEHRPVETVVHGGMSPYALVSLLGRLEAHGLRVVSFQRLRPTGPVAIGPASGSARERRGRCREDWRSSGS